MVRTNLLSMEQAGDETKKAAVGTTENGEDTP